MDITYYLMDDSIYKSDAMLFASFDMSENRIRSSFIADREYTEGEDIQDLTGEFVLACEDVLCLSHIADEIACLDVRDVVFEHHPGRTWNGGFFISMEYSKENDAWVILTNMENAAQIMGGCACLLSKYEPENGEKWESLISLFGTSLIKKVEAERKEKGKKPFNKKEFYRELFLDGLCAVRCSSSEEISEVSKMLSRSGLRISGKSDDKTPAYIFCRKNGENSRDFEITAAKNGLSPDIDCIIPFKSVSQKSVP